MDARTSLEQAQSMHANCSGVRTRDAALIGIGLALVDLVDKLNTTNERLEGIQAGLDRVENAVAHTG